MSEEWRDVPGYEGCYQVSSDGQVRRVAGSFGCTRTRILKKSPNRLGYETIRPSKGGVKKTVNVHAFVALAFLGECPEGYEINHKNGIKSDNRINNLEYVTRSENILHAIHVLKRDMVPNSKTRLLSIAKVTEDDVRTIRRLYHDDACTIKGLARLYQMSYEGIRAIVRERSWKHVQWDSQKAS